MVQYPSLFSVVDSIVYKKAPLLHMVGVKRNFQSEDIFNLEWLLRDVADDECVHYAYNDKYYLYYMEKMGILEFSSLIEFIRSHLIEKLKNEILHLWLMAIDYFPDGRKKYKLYLKGNPYGENFDLQDVFSIFF